MSYTLDIDSPSRPVVRATEDGLEIDGIEIGMNDFAFLVIYVLGNIDLTGDDDPRRRLVQTVSEMREVDGWNPGKIRLEAP